MIKLVNVHKTYIIGEEVVKALDGVSLEIKEGEMVSIVGASGSGKTTTMHMIGLLDHPTSGECYINGKEVSQLSRNEKAALRNRTIGFIFQSFFLLPRLDALHNVMLPLSYRDNSERVNKNLAFESLKKVSMDHYIHHHPNQLSGGQQQRVAIARALVGDPKIILADEPTGSLDSRTGQEVMDLLKNINKTENATVIIVTHDPNIAKQCQRIISIKDGKIVKKDVV